MRTVVGVLVLVVCLALAASRGATASRPRVASSAANIDRSEDVEAPWRRRSASAASGRHPPGSRAETLGGRRLPIVLDGRPAETLFDPDR